MQHGAVRHRLRWQYSHKKFEINYITVLQGKENGEINFREDFLLRKGENVKGCIALDFAPIGNKFALFSKSKTVMVPTGLSVDLNIFHILQHLRLWSTLLYLCMCILDWTHGSIVFDVLFKNISHEALCICVHMSILYLVSSNPLLYLNIAYVWSFKQLYEVPIWITWKLNFDKNKVKIFKKSLCSNQWETRANCHKV